MTITSADSVKVEWTGTGTSTPVTLGAAVPGFQAVPAALNGKTVSYLIEHKGDGIFERENGRGIYTHSGTTLTRGGITFSTSSNSLVNFSAGTKHIALILLVDDLNTLIGSGLPDVTRLDLSSGNQTYTLLDADAEGDHIVFHGASGTPTINTDPTVEQGLWFFSCEEDVDQAWVLDVDEDSIVHVGDGESTSDASITLNRSSTYGLLQLTGTGSAATYRLWRMPGNNELGDLAAKDTVGSTDIATEMISGLTADGAPDGAADYTLVLDATGPSYKKVLLNNLPAGGGGTARTFSGTLTPDVAEVVYANFSQSGAQSFTQGSGTVTGSTHYLPFNSDGSTLTWNAGFVAADGMTADNLPDSLTAGWYLIGFVYHAARDDFIVTWTRTERLPLSGGTMSGDIDMDGNDILLAGGIVSGNRAEVLTSVSGSLTTASHSGRALVTSGNVTVPNAAGDVGFNATIIAGGAHTVTFNSLTSPAMASGGVMNVLVQSTTVIKAVYTAPADLVSFS